MFWEIFYELCAENGKKPNPVAEEIGVSSASVTKWKKTSIIPSSDILIKIADYFGCSLDYLVGRSCDRSITTNSGNDMDIPFTDDELRIVEKYRMLDHDGKDAVRGVLLSEQRRVEAKAGDRHAAAV